MRQQGAGRARRAPNQAQVTCRLDPGFRVDLHQNDLNLALASARALGLALPNTAAVQALFICGHVAKIERALALFMVVSWRIARLMRLGRTCPDLPASLMFAPDEIRAAYVLTNKPSPAAPPRSTRLCDAWPCSAVSSRARATVNPASKPSGSDCSASWISQPACASCVTRATG